MNGKTISEEQERTQFASSSARPSHWRVVCEQGINIEDSEVELNDNGNSGFEAIILASKKTFKPHDSCFGGQKRRDKWHCKANDIQPENF